MPTQPISSALLEHRLAEVRVELERRLQQGERGVCEDILARNADLSANAECVLELVYTEFATLERAGDNPDPQEFARRFPDLRQRLARILKIHTVFDDGQADEEGAQQSWPWLDVPQTTAKSETDDGEHADRQRVGNYELLQEVGRGGMGIVFRARQAGLGRIVALKMIRSPLATREELTRFRNEAATDARLEHANIVSIHEINEHQGCPYLSLEYVDGGNLADRLADRPIRAVEATRLIETLARAVAYAHERGVVHRDLKPANILLTANGQPKIADFGLAKLLDTLTEDDIKHSGLTQTGAVLGTPCYMSPEQTGGNPDAIGPATDIYSLGTLYYEMLTGRPPFQGESTIETLEQIRHHEPPPPRRLRPRVPRDFETICLKCLEKEPARRYPSAVLLADDLARALAGEPIRARPIRFPERAAKWIRRRPAVAALVAAVVLVALLGAAGVIWQWRRAEEGWQQAEAALAKVENARQAELALRHEAQHGLYLHLIATAHRDLLSHRFRQAEISLGQCDSQFRHWEWHYLNRLCHPEWMALTPHKQPVRRVAYVPDGKRIVTATGSWGTGQPGELSAFRAETGEVIWETQVESGPVMDIAVSPDGRLLATACVNFDRPTEKTVTLWVSDTGEELRSLPTSIGNTFAITFSPDGALLATGGADGMVRIFNVESTEAVHVLEGHTDNVFGVAFRPDGKVVASASRDSSTRIWDVSSGALVRSLPCEEDQRSVVFSPEGRRLATAGYGGAALLWDLSSEVAEPVVLRVDAPMVRGLSFAPDGHLLAGIDAVGSVYLWDIPSGVKAATIYGHDAFGNQTAFSPDGLRLASASGDHTVKIWDLTARATDTESVTGGGWVGDLAYSPDGRALAVASSRNQVNSDYVDYAARIINLADRNDVRTLAGHSDWLNCIAYSSDGSRLATGSRDCTIRIWDAAGGEWVVTLAGHSDTVNDLVFAGDRLFSASDDGTLLAWDAMTGSQQLCLQQQSTGIRHLAVANDETLAACDVAGEIHFWNAATGQPLPATVKPGGVIRAMAFSPCGQRLFAAISNEIVVWDTSTLSVPTLARVKTLSGHSAPVTGLAASPDGRRLVSAGRDKTVRLWDTGTGREILTLKTPVEDMFNAAFHPNGKQIVAVYGAFLKTWDISRPDASVTSARVREWQLQRIQWLQHEAAACEADEDWHTAVFYRQRVIQLLESGSMFPTQAARHARHLAAARQALANAAANSDATENKMETADQG